MQEHIESGGAKKSGGEPAVQAALLIESHPLVAKKIAEIKPHETKVLFPGEVPATPLKSGDYQNLLQLLHDRSKKSKAVKGMDELTISYCDDATLAGLIAYNDTKQKLPIQSLILDLTHLDLNQPKALDKLKALLLSLSTNNLTTLQISDPLGKLKEADLEVLADFIKKQSIAVDITIPTNKRTAKIQQSIDEATSDPIRNRAIQAFGQTFIASDKVDVPVGKKPKAKGKQSPTISIEMQEEQQHDQQQDQQVDIAVAVAVEASIAVDASTEQSAKKKPTGLTMEGFATRLQTNGFSSASKSYLVNADDAKKIWCNWVGALSEYDVAANPLKISEAACEELLRYFENFQYGLDLQRLPPGFTLLTDRSGKTIHFDKNIKLLSDYDPIRVQTSESAAVKSITTSQFAQWLQATPDDNAIKKAWGDINKQPYSKEVHRLFKQFLPEMLMLSKENLTVLFKHSFDKGVFNNEKFKFLMADRVKLKGLTSSNLNQYLSTTFTNKDEIIKFLKAPTVNLPLEQHLLHQLIKDDAVAVKEVHGLIQAGADKNRVLQLYIELGTKGLQAVNQIAKKDPTFFKELDKYVFSKNQGYSALLTKEYQDSIVGIQGLSANEKVWWNKLLEQHCAVQGDVNLVDLAKAFFEFKAKLKELKTFDAKPLMLPAACELQGVKSLPVALSRILTLLEHSSEQNRHAQLAEASRLDLSSNGMIKVIPNKVYDQIKPCAFVAKEMNINAAHEMAHVNNAKQYSFLTEWKTIPVGDNAQIVENFFRFASYQQAVEQNKGQLPFEFYQHAHNKIKDSGLSVAVKKELYAFIATSSVGVETVKTIKSVESAKHDVDEIIKVMKKFPFEGMRTVLIQSYKDLEEIPPLPIFSRLTKLIAASVNSPSILLNSDRLMQANNDLKKIVGVYGPIVYEGMKDYPDVDYENKELFFNHLDVLKTIHGYWEKRSTDVDNAKSLSSMISSFHLTSAEIGKIYPLIDYLSNTPSVSEESKRFVAGMNNRQEALKLLRSISVNDSRGLRALNGDDVVYILQQINAAPKNTLVSDTLKQLKLAGDVPLADYFPKDFLDYVKQPIDPALNQLMADKFSQKQREFIFQIFIPFQPGYSAPIVLPFYQRRAGGADKPAEYKADAKYIVDTLITICGSMSAVQKNTFLESLSSRDLCANKDQFKKLLGIIATRKCSEEFINFMVAQRNLAKNNAAPKDDDLATKALFYLDDFLPASKVIVKDKNLSQMDLTPRILETLLRTPAAQLTGDTFADERTKAFHTQEQALSVYVDALKKGTLTNITQIVESTNTFIVNGISKKHAGPLEGFTESLTRNFNPNDGDFWRYGRSLKENAHFQLLQSLPNDQNIHGLMNRKGWEDLYSEFDGKEYRYLLNNRAFFNVLLNNQQLLVHAKKTQEARYGSGGYITSKQQMQQLIHALVKDLEKLIVLHNEAVNLLNNLKNEREEFNSYAPVFNDLLKNINILTKDNPASKKQFLELYDRYLKNYNSEKDGTLLSYQSHFVETLKQGFALTKDSNIVLALCLKFNGVSAKYLQPADLLELLKAIDGKGPQPLEAKDKELVLKIAVALINNDKEYKLEDIKTLIQAMKGSAELTTELETTLYKRAPFPTITEVLKWHKEFKDAPFAWPVETYSEKMSKAYNEYSKTLRPKDDGKNGFKESIATEKLKQFNFNGTATKVDIADFNSKIQAMRGKTSEELLTCLKTFNPQDPNKPVDYETLVAVTAELLHRSKASKDDSMELNTTQYLAVLTALKTEGHVTSQISTGEGKSRIMMIMLACQWAQGKTVDFVTSDAQLATRDYVKFRSFFEMMGAKTRMVFANSDPATYQVGGINFTDPSNLSLFRNKARSSGKGHLVIDPKEENRSLMLDEADKTYFDVADTRFNYSAEAGENIKGMEWVYPLFMEYLSQDFVSIGSKKISPIDLYHDDKNASRDTFLQFVSNNYPKETEKVLRLKGLSNKQLDQWQDSAVQASRLVFKKDFGITPDMLISTSHGLKTSSEARLLSAEGVELENSKYSFGVHQFLHARLNRARENIDAVNDPLLKEALQACNNPFFIQAEKQIVYSSTNKNLLDDYKNGTLKAVTGTSGSILERNEAKSLFTRQEQPMRFIDVPRHNELKRQDKAIRLTADKEAQIETLVKQIIAAQKKNQPILIIAEDDAESELLYKKIQQKLPLDPTKIQLNDSKVIGNAQDEQIARAGKPGQITISTKKLGRGIDIPLDDKAKDGLNVMLTFLPRQRDLEQIVGRSGRYGALGESSMVLNKVDLKKALGKTTLTDGFYTHTESYIAREQAVMDRNKQCERLIRNTAGDFGKAVTDNFYSMRDKISAAEPHLVDQLIPLWSQFVDSSDKTWNDEIWPSIQDELSADKVNIGNINQLLVQYQSQIQASWNTLRSTIDKQDIKFTVNNQKVSPNQFLRDKIDPLKLDVITEALMRKFDINQYNLTKTTHEKWDRGHEGRASTYKGFMVPTIATLKWMGNLFLSDKNKWPEEDTRRPFANTIASWEGRGQLFANTRAWWRNLTGSKSNIGEKPDSSVVDDAPKNSGNGSYATFVNKGIQSTTLRTDRSAEDDLGHQLKPAEVTTDLTVAESLPPPPPPIAADGDNDQPTAGL